MKRSTFASGSQLTIVAELALSLLVASSAMLGCGKSAAPPSEARLEIENIAKWRQLFLANHNRQPPTDEAEFITFIEQKMNERGEKFDRDKFLTSPRDGQKFVVRYGKDSAKLRENDVAVHEKEGYNGKVLVAFESARSVEVDAAQLPSLLAGKP